MDNLNGQDGTHDGESTGLHEVKLPQYSTKTPETEQA